MSKQNQTPDIPTQDTPVKLKHPFTTAAGVPIEQIHVKQINVRQMKNAQRQGGDDQAETETIMVAMACDLVVEDLDEMMMIDYVAVRDRFQKLNLNHTQRQVAESAGATG